jgi:hypothetical protein
MGWSVKGDGRILEVGVPASRKPGPQPEAREPGDGTRWEAAPLRTASNFLGYSGSGRCLLLRVKRTFASCPLYVRL